MTLSTRWSLEYTDVSSLPAGCPWHQSAASCRLSAHCSSVHTTFSHTTDGCIVPVSVVCVTRLTCLIMGQAAPLVRRPLGGNVWHCNQCVCQICSHTLAIENYILLTLSLHVRYNPFKHQWIVSIQRIQLSVTNRNLMCHCSLWPGQTLLRSPMFTSSVTLMLVFAHGDQTCQ